MKNGGAGDCACGESRNSFHYDSVRRPARLTARRVCRRANSDSTIDPEGRKLKFGLLGRTSHAGGLTGSSDKEKFYVRQDLQTGPGLPRSKSL